MTPRTFVAPILVHDVIDGDTIRATLDLGWKVRVEVTIRLDGLDTPEVRHANPLHKRAGELVREWVRRTLADRTLELYSSSLDLYGRSLGDIQILGPQLAWIGHLLLGHGYAKPTGASGKRLGWTDEELQGIVDRLTVQP